MPRQNINQTNFTSGEISPLVGGRLDTKVYGNGLRTCKNFIVRPQGGAVFRCGTKLIAPAKFHDSTCRLFPFDFSDVQGYCMIFGDGYIHITKNGHKLFETTTTEIESFDLFDDGGLMNISVTNTGNLPGWGDINTFYSAANNGDITLSAGTGTKVRVTTTLPHTLRTGALATMRSTEIAGINNGIYSVTRISAYAVDLDSSTYSAPGAGNTAMFSHGVIAGDEFYISGATDYPQLANQWHRAESVFWNGITIANMAYIRDAGAPASEEGHTIPIEIITTYTAAQLAEIRVAQSADVLYIFHPDHPPRKLVRLSDDGDMNDWLLADVVFTDGPYLPLNDAAPALDETTPANGTRFTDVYLEVSDYTSTATVKIPAIPLTSVANDGGVYVVTTPSGHGLTAGDLVVIAGTGTTADGNRVVTAAVTATTFHIGVAYGAASSTGTYQPAFKTGDDSKYFEFKDSENWRLAQLPSTMADYDVTATVSIIENVLLYDEESFRIKNTPKKKEDVSLVPVYDKSGKLINYQQASSQDYHKSNSDSDATGNIVAQFSNAFTRSDVGKYIRFHGASLTTYYWARINSVNSTGTTAAHDKSLADTAAVGGTKMASINGSGCFVITDEARTATVKSYKNNATHALFNTTNDIGRHIRLGFSNRWAWGKITAAGSTGSVTVSLYSPMPRDPNDASKLAGSVQGLTTSSARSVGRTYNWRLGAWSATTGYPSTAVFHESRLWFGRTDTEPSTVWASVTGDYENMSPTEPDGLVLADSGIRYPIASGRVNAIKWMESGTALIVGTNGGEWLAKSSSVNQEPLSQANVGLTQQSRNGSSRYAQSVRVGSSLLFINRSEQKMMEVAYLFSEDSLKDKDVTVAAEHIIRQGGRIVEIVYQQNPNSVIWCLLSDGSLAALTHNNNQEILGWHRHEVGGSGFIESICCVPSEDGTSDVLHMVVKRTINGGTYRTIEYLTPDFHANGATARTGMVFLDCAHVVSGFSGSNVSVTGLNNLEGKTVTVLSNGTVVSTTAQVSGGAITVATAGNELVIGLPYTGTLTSLPIEGGSPNGSSQGMKKRVAELKVRLFESFGFRSGTFLGSAPTTLENVTSHDVTAKNETFTPLPFFSGTVAINPKMGNDLESVWTIQQTNPYPLTVLSVTSVPETSQ